jgi:putative addiction module component (TIGR02574 family)
MAALAMQIADAAMHLPAEERVALVDLLLKSLNIPTQRDIDALWAVEAENRVQEIDSGAVQMLDGEQVFKAIRQRLKQC